MHVRFACAEVAALHRVVEQPVDAVAVVLIVLRGVDAALRGDRVGPARGVLVAERAHVVAELGHRRGGGAAGQAGADHDDGILYPGAFLWRFMIAAPFQSLGFGRKAIALLIHDLKYQGYKEIRLGYSRGEGSPEAFYTKLGFKLTGGTYGEHELEAVLKFD